MAPETGPVRDRLVEAGYQVFAEQGVRDGTMLEVARRAGVGRATLYRQFPGKESLLRALVLREARNLFELLDAELAGCEEPDELLERGLLTAFGYLRTHALLQRTLEKQPEELLPLLTVRAGPLLDAGVEFVAPYVERAVKSERMAPVPPRVAAEWAARVLLSLLLTPSVTVDLGDPQELKRFVGYLTQGGIR
jgi:AcrR family transcriptional regulator